MQSLDPTRAVLEAALAEFGEVTLRLENLSRFDHLKPDPAAPSAGCWFPDTRTLWLDTRCMDFEASLEHLAAMVAQSAAESADDWLALGVE